MLTKKIKTISLTALLLEEEETSEDKVETQKNEKWVPSGLYGIE